MTSPQCDSATGCVCISVLVSAWCGWYLQLPAVSAEWSCQHCPSQATVSAPPVLETASASGEWTTGPAGWIRVDVRASTGQQLPRWHIIGKHQSSEDSITSGVGRGSHRSMYRGFNTPRPQPKYHLEREDLAVSRLRRPTHVLSQKLSLAKIRHVHTVSGLCPEGGNEGFGSSHLPCSVFC